MLSQIIVSLGNFLERKKIINKLTQKIIDKKDEIIAMQFFHLKKELEDYFKIDLSTASFAKLIVLRAKMEVEKEAKEIEDEDEKK